MKKAALLMILPMLLTAGACTSRIGADQYDTSAVGEVNRAVKGTVVSVRQISIASNNGAGTLIGGAAGGVAGSMIGGSDTAHILGAIGGAVVGGIARQRGAGRTFVSERLRICDSTGQRQHGYRLAGQ